MAAELTEATAAADRIETLDFLRGCALFGILLMNITGFALPHAYEDPTVYGGATGRDLWAWMVVQIAFEGTQRGLFSLLFGAGVVLFMARLEAAGRRDAADIYVRRNLWLIGLGLFNAWVLLWSGDILYCYGITALFVFAFRNLAGRTLLIVGVAALLANAAWNATENAELLGQHAAYRAATAAPVRNKAQSAAIETWRGVLAEAKPSAETLAADVGAMRGGYASAYGPVAEANIWSQSSSLYRGFFDVFGMMLIGMGLFKLGVLTLRRSTRSYAAMTVAGYLVGIGVNAAETAWIVQNGFSVVAFSQANVTYDLGRLATTIGHLGLLLLFCRSGALSWLRRSMAAVGRMALTNYLTHSAVCLVLFVGLGWFGRLQRFELYYVVVAIWTVQFVASPLWLRHFRYGPVEWLWRYLTYGRRDRFRVAAGAPVAIG